MSGLSGISDVIAGINKLKDFFGMATLYRVQLKTGEFIEVDHEVGKQLKALGHTIVSKRDEPQISWPGGHIIIDIQKLQQLFGVDYPRTVDEALEGDSTFNLTEKE